MKRIIALFLVCTLLLSSCSAHSEPIDIVSTADYDVAISVETSDELPVFTGLADPLLLQHIEENAATEISLSLNRDLFYVEHVSAIFISREYIEELAFNSQANIYFGYTLEELYEEFQDSKFIFTLGEDGQTVVQAFEEYDDTFDRIIRNVAVGTGVILLCVTVALVAPPLGAPAAVTTVFAVSAKAGSFGALTGGVFSGLISGVVTGISSNNVEDVLTSVALAASEGFMWGAITGTIFGGTQAAIALRGTGKYLQGGRGFNTFDEAKAVMGSARSGKEVHHIVGQNPTNLARFNATDIHNTRNLVALDANTHRIITAHGNSIQPYTNGQRVHQWLSTQTFEQQFDYSINLIREFGTMTSTSSGWIFSPF
ncbi:MAG: hypothetical protein FWH05_05150 [Oscillospiraceae bacterium]|nr:hypothetical protein [Oscillospiraceae bacterium]